MIFLYVLDHDWPLCWCRRGLKLMVTNCVLCQDIVQSRLLQLGHYHDYYIRGASIGVGEPTNAQHRHAVYVLSSPSRVPGRWLIPLSTSAPRWQLSDTHHSFSVPNLPPGVLHSQTRILNSTTKYIFANDSATLQIGNSVRSRLQVCIIHKFLVEDTCTDGDS